MDFYLTYEGPLRSNGSPTEKHQIREHFYSQLVNVWNLPHLRGGHRYLLEPDGSLNVLKKVKDVTFAPLICNKLRFFCDLDITLLWHDEPGSIVNRGDIDNRLKTLFDSLTCPDSNQLEQVLKKYSLADKQPYFCLLEDDKLISSIKVQTQTLLKDNDADTVFLIIKVTINTSQLDLKTFLMAM